jgi:hypothetical protein
MRGFGLTPGSENPTGARFDWIGGASKDYPTFYAQHTPDIYILLRPLLPGPARFTKMKSRFLVKSYIINGIINIIDHKFIDKLIRAKIKLFRPL